MYTRAMRLVNAGTANPTLLGSFPVFNATAVGAPMAVLQLQFSEVVKVDTGDVVIYDESDSSTLTTVSITSGSVSVSGTTLNVLLPVSAPAGKLFTVTIPSTAVISHANRYFAGVSGKQWQFRTTTTGAMCL